MPELHEANRQVPGPPITTVDEVPESGNGYSDPPQPQESVTSPEDSVSEISFPFDSQSSVDEETGNCKTNILYALSSELRRTSSKERNAM